MKKNPTLLFVVAAALVRGNGTILLQQRPENRSMAGLWEFPGGKVEPNETPEQALVRELHEELGIGVNAADLTASCFASAMIGDRPLVLLLYLCRHWTGEPVALESPQLGWYPLGQMRDLPMPPADIPLIAMLEKLVQD